MLGVIGVVATVLTKHFAADDIYAYIVGGIGIILLVVLVITLGLLISRYFNAAWVYFCRSLKFGDFFNFGKIIDKYDKIESLDTTDYIPL